MLQFLLPFLPQLLGMGATALGSGATALGATGLGSALAGAGSTLGGLGASSLLGGMLGGAQSAPQAPNMGHAVGLMGNERDMGGKLLTESSKGLGGGMLGGFPRGKAFEDMMGMMAQGAAMSGSQPQETMPAAPASRYTSDYKPISRPRDPDEELRKRRLAYLTRRY